MDEKYIVAGPAATTSGSDWQGLNPVKMVARGLMAAFEDLAAGVEGAFQVRCVCEFPELVVMRDHAVANHLYRIAQEAIQNAVKHGKARTIRIKLKPVRGGHRTRSGERRGGVPGQGWKARRDGAEQYGSARPPT